MRLSSTRIPALLLASPEAHREHSWGAWRRKRLHWCCRRSVPRGEFSLNSLFSELRPEGILSLPGKRSLMLNGCVFLKCQLIKIGLSVKSLSCIVSIAHVTQLLLG